MIFSSCALLVLRWKDVKARRFYPRCAAEEVASPQTPYLRCPPSPQQACRRVGVGSVSTPKHVKKGKLGITKELGLLRSEQVELLSSNILEYYVKVFNKWLSDLQLKALATLSDWSIPEDLQGVVASLPVWSFMCILLVVFKLFPNGSVKKISVGTWGASMARPGRTRFAVW